MNCTIWNLRYPLHTKNYVDSMLPIIIGADIKVKIFNFLFYFANSMLLFLGIFSSWRMWLPLLLA